MTNLFRSILSDAGAATAQPRMRRRNLFDDNPLGRYLMSPQGYLLDVNLALIHMLGYPDRESLMVQNENSLFISAADRQKWRERMDRRGVVHRFESQMRRKDGSIIWVRETAMAVKDPAGRVLSYEGSMEDITDLKRDETDQADLLFERHFWEAFSDWKLYF